jgi:anti-anti-sigma factor
LLSFNVTPQTIIFDAEAPSINHPAEYCFWLDTWEGVSDALANTFSFTLDLAGLTLFGTPFSVDSPSLRSYYRTLKRGVRAQPGGWQGSAVGDDAPGQDFRLLIEGLPMILNVQKKSPSSSVGILELHGRLMMGNDSRQVEWSVDEWIKGGVKSIVLDLSDLDMIDSTGVGIIVMCHAKLEKAGGSLRIAGTQGIIQDILHMTHVDRIVRFFATAEEASENFAPA